MPGGVDPGQLTLTGDRQARLGEFDAPPRLEPLSVGSECRVCGEDFGQTGRLLTHVLVEHTDLVNERLAELHARCQPSTNATNGTEESDVIRVNPDGPTTVPEEPPGERLGRASDPRECDVGGPDCLGRMSRAYARVFARDVDGYLACPSCQSRAERYTGDAPEANETKPDPLVKRTSPAPPTVE